MRKKKDRWKKSPPSSYDTMPWYFPTEQVDIKRKLRLDKGKKRKGKSKT